MKIIVLLAFLGFAAAFDFPEQWEAWKSAHKKVYGSLEEELERHTIWQSNKKYIDEHNANADLHGFTLAMNEFGDLDPAEFSKMYNSYRGAKSVSTAPCTPYQPKGNTTSKVDWRDKGYVTPIKNQGQCGSCWAFSTTGSLEGQHFKATGKLVSLSEQNLVDCSTAEGNEGCNGGLMDDAFNYIIKNGGIDTESSYPYKAHDETCNFNKANVGATMKACQDIKSKSEADLLDAATNIGPISVAIDASHLSFQMYSGGVYHSILCSQTRLDHGVLVVGYGTYEGKDYWLVKNSWGTSWGLNGYIMMSRNRDNNCGIATSASFPIV